MKRRTFISIAGGAIIAAGTTGYLLSDRSNFVRSDLTQEKSGHVNFYPGERDILFLSSLAPSGHNTQPWFIKRIEPYHWIIGNDRSKWLPAVDPTQRETILSIGAFMQNLEYAANNLGYNCRFSIIALANQEENVSEVWLTTALQKHSYPIQEIINRRTVRSNLLDDPLKVADLKGLIGPEQDTLHFIANGSKEFYWLNEQTIEANKIQSYRDVAQKELAAWIRFSSKEAERYRDGLTTASMEIEGFQGWVLRNFYGKSNVMQQRFRAQSIDKVVQQVGHSAGWLLITTKDQSVIGLIETGMRMQRLFLKVRSKSIAIHPMTQILEEGYKTQPIRQTLGISDSVQFILRTGYLKAYPAPVTLRRSVEDFIRA